MVDSTASLCTVFKTVRNLAVVSTICHRSGSQTARVARAMRTPVVGDRMVCVTRAICEPLWRQMVDPTASLCT
eukprot:11198009-Lingulodinium_polyedra.AAC.1